VDALITFLTVAKETTTMVDCRSKDVFAQLKTKDYEIGITNLIEYVSFGFCVISI
jgi:hypothetical protein